MLCTAGTYGVLTHRLCLASLRARHSLSCVGLRERLDDGLRTLHMTLILRVRMQMLCTLDAPSDLVVDFAIHQVLDEEKSDSESAFRALTALGNTVRRLCSLLFHIVPLELTGILVFVFVLVLVLGCTAQIFAARKHAAPLGAPQLPAIRRVLGSVTGAFAEDRVRNMAGEITGLL